MTDLWFYTTYWGEWCAHLETPSGFLLNFALLISYITRKTKRKRKTRKDIVRPYVSFSKSKMLKKQVQLLRFTVGNTIESVIVMLTWEEYARRTQLGENFELNRTTLKSDGDFILALLPLLCSSFLRKRLKVQPNSVKVFDFFLKNKPTAQIHHMWVPVADMGFWY